MPVIYCLFATNEGRPRYVGQTTKAVESRLDQHIRDATRNVRTPLQRWIRATIDAGFQVQAHVLQFHVQPSDLDLFERYWIGQFTGLLNDQRGILYAQVMTKVGFAIEKALQGRLSSCVPIQDSPRLPAVMPGR